MSGGADYQKRLAIQFAKINSVERGCGSECFHSVLERSPGSRTDSGLILLSKPEPHCSRGLRRLGGVQPAPLCVAIDAFRVRREETVFAAATDWDAGGARHSMIRRSE